MRLTSFTDYGLRALMRLAGEPERLFTTEQIAREFGISRNHLIKVVRELAHAGIIATQKGSGGGFRLARAAEGISLGEIVRLLEAKSVLVECFRFDGGMCVLTPGCRLKGRLKAAQDAFLRELDHTMLVECAWPPPGTVQLPITGIRDERQAAMSHVVTKRVYDPQSPEDGLRVLVDRIWPRGVSKKDAAIDHWAKDLAPSTQLRKWFSHDPAKWDGFKARYQMELEGRSTELRDLLARGGNRTITLLFAAKDTEHNQAIVLRDVLLIFRQIDHA